METEAEIKRIVCLSVSKKWTGNCVAGKEVLNSGYGKWVRPVSTGGVKGEISLREMRYPDRTYPGLLDVIEIPVSKYCPSGFEVENYLINTGHPWRKIGKLGRESLNELLTPYDKDFWLSGFSSTGGRNDRVPYDFASRKIKGSLALIRPEGFRIVIEFDFEWSPEPKRRIKGMFHLNGADFKLVITDPRIWKKYLRKEPGEYPLSDAYLCISLAPFADGYCQRFIAGVILPEE